MKLKSQKGFTLIELLVVVAIIGVLATVVLSSLSAARGRAKDAKVKLLLNQMRTQTEIQYGIDYSDVCSITDGNPTSTAKLFLDALANGSSNASNSLCDAEGPNYIGAIGGTSPSSHSTNGNPSSTDSNGSFWAASISLSTGEWFCVDSTGGAGVYSSRSIGGGSPIDRTCG